MSLLIEYCCELGIHYRHLVDNKQAHKSEKEYKYKGIYIPTGDEFLNRIACPSSVKSISKLLKRWNESLPDKWRYEEVTP